MLSLFLGILSLAASPAQVDAGSRGELRVLSYNLNYGRAGSASILRVIEEADADLVVLQETHAGWERALEARLAKRYPYRSYRHDRRPAGGLALLSRYPFAAGEVLPSALGRFPAWRTVVETPLGPLQVLAVHLVPTRPADGESWMRGWVRGYYESQERRLRETDAYLAALQAGVPTIVAGDFNEDARGRSLARLAERGFANALELFDRGRATWRWTTRAGEVRWQLDHILASSDLEVTGAGVIDGGDSDHLAVLATIRRGAPVTSRGR